MADSDPPNRDTDSDDLLMHGAPASMEDWIRLPSDPDLHADLGYELIELETYETDKDHLLFLPRDEDMLRDEAFIVVREIDVCSLGE